ncbi:hypothetical protein [Methylobacterium terrae]|uniref:hypothetical protein n=1 Tax=Methylobacterium terrae TaxID=2202827 RepID=UPI001FDEB832|nr:hypothetical protein [Methylobacterium terrae]
MARSLMDADVCRCTCFVSSRRSERTEGNLAEFRQRFPSASVEELETSDPLATAQRLFNVLSAEVAATGFRDLVLDITSFRREELLMLLAVLRTLSLSSSEKSEILYVGAGVMADWLSGQVTSLRSVVGYAGEMWPSRPTCLVVLIGFEFSRARSIIENYEPKTLILGKGLLAESINPELGARNNDFFRELHSQYDNVAETFEFSARDPFSTADKLEQVVPLDASSNVIVAPLHTKLSTLGAGLFASRHPEVQVCYASVDTYNELEYSTIGTETFSIGLDALVRC